MTAAHGGDGDGGLLPRPSLKVDEVLVMLLMAIYGGGTAPQWQGSIVCCVEGCLLVADRVPLLI